MANINKIGAICIRDNKLLLVHKKEVGYIALGGKIEQGETDTECLQREVKEEIGCNVKNPKYWMTFQGQNHDNTKTLQMKCYFCEINGEPTINPKDSIDGYIWIGKDYKKIENQIAQMMRLQILPQLIQEGKI